MVGETQTPRPGLLTSGGLSPTVCAVGYCHPALSGLLPDQSHLPVACVVVHPLSALPDRDSGFMRGLCHV